MLETKHMARIRELAEMTSLHILADAIESSLADALKYNREDGIYRKVEVESLLESLTAKFQVFRKRTLDNGGK